MSKKEDVKLRIARCIIGPLFDLPSESKYTLEQLRDVRWNKAAQYERQSALNAAEAIMRDMHVFPRKERISQMAFMKAEHEKERAKTSKGEA